MVLENVTDLVYDDSADSILACVIASKACPDAKCVRMRHPADVSPHEMGPYCVLLGVNIDPRQLSELIKHGRVVSAISPKKSVARTMLNMTLVDSPWFLTYVEALVIRKDDPLDSTMNDAKAFSRYVKTKDLHSLDGFRKLAAMNPDEVKQFMANARMTQSTIDAIVSRIVQGAFQAVVEDSKHRVYLAVCDAYLSAKVVKQMSELPCDFAVAASYSIDDDEWHVTCHVGRGKALDMLDISARLGKEQQGNAIMSHFTLQGAGALKKCFIVNKY